jgi:peptide/nickel transport system substrate-binding protein
MRRTFVLGWTVVLSLALVAAACGDDDDDDEGGAGPTAAGSETTAAASGSATTAGGDITIALGSEPTSLDPQAVDDGGERAINDNIYETLLARTQDGELVPGLAAEMPTQLDATTWQFTLREGVTFHNGEPFDADSVVASVQRMVELIAEDATEQSGFFSSITGATKVDDLTVDITTDGPDGVLPSRMYWLKMVPAQASADPSFAENPVGTGPYTFVEFARGDHITLAANPDYWDGAPSVGQIRYVFLEEPGTRLAGLLSGDYDLITNLQPEDVERAPQAAHVQGQEHPVLILDADEGITADPAVREALNLAVDKAAIAEELFGGLAQVDAGQVLSPSILGHNPALQPYAYDPDAAAAMLEEAGVAGESITLVGTSGRWLKDREIVEAVADFWSDAGLEVDLQVLEFGAYLDVLFDRESRADAIFVSSSNDLLDADRQLATYYHMDGIGASNTDQTLAGLIDDARSETDPAGREALYHDALELAYEDAYFVWLVNNEDIYGLSERLQWTPRVDSKLLVKEMAVLAG